MDIIRLRWCDSSYIFQREKGFLWPGIYLAGSKENSIIKKTVNRKGGKTMSAGEEGKGRTAILILIYPFIISA